ncbi:MAG: sigma-70 family RNA polymerase sigma factor [Chloroflexi bacterium]|nr:sigma-70 family RNA polymerase sigma factor [Chloroflexota bacterium]
MVALEDVGAALAHNQSSESDLIQRAVSGDPDAFATLYDAYVEQIYRFVYFRVGDEQTAEDLTSQVFLKAWDKLSSYQIRGLPFSAWLFRIARNNVIDYYRTFKETTSLEPDVIARPDPAADVDNTIERRLEAEEVRLALQHLTEDQQQVLTLRFIEGLSTEEVAKVMGKRPGAIRALQMRGLQALAQIFGSSDE